MISKRRRFGAASGVVLLVSGAVLAGVAGAAADDRVLPPAAPRVTMPDGTQPPKGCLFKPGTVIPRMAMGVCTLEMAEPIRRLERLRLWSAPPASIENADAAGEQPLFKPLFVYAQHGGGRPENTWYLLAANYADAGRSSAPNLLGWASGAQLHLLESRYAYSYMNLKREHPVELYETAADAYEAIELQSRRPPQDQPDLVLIAERKDRDYWDPRNLSGAPPFIELPAPVADVTDTTLTFAAVPENRLLHVGAVCGGPVTADLKEMQERADARVRVAILFVIDGTQSMEEFYGSIAEFVGQIANVDQVDMKAGAVWYRDEGVRRPTQGPSPAHDEPVVVDGELKAVTATRGGGLSPLGPEEAKQLAAAIRGFKVVTPEPPGDQPEELMFDGLKAGIETCFVPDGAPHDLALVIVIGDTGDRREGKELQSQLQQVGKLAVERNLRFEFIRVGTGAMAYHTSFDEQAGELAALPGMQGRVDLPRAGGIKDAAALTSRMREIVAELEQEQGRLRREISKIRMRNQFAVPGRKMEAGIDRGFGGRKVFDERNLQVFVPAFGWLYHPQHPDGNPQLRELAYLADPEADALVAVFRSIAEQYPRADTARLNVDAAIDRFGDVLARRSQHPQVEEAVAKAKDALPADQRTFGSFLRDGLGLRLTNPLLHHQGSLASVEAKARAADTFARMAERLTQARGRDPSLFWYDSWKVLQAAGD